jgi:hypothetical protein
MSAPTTKQVAAAIEVVRAVADTVKELGRAPRGVLYAALMRHGATLADYEKIEAMLIRASLVRRSGEELIWIAS